MSSIYISSSTTTTEYDRVQLDFDVMAFGIFMQTSIAFDQEMRDKVRQIFDDFERKKKEAK